MQLMVVDASGLVVEQKFTASLVVGYVGCEVGEKPNWDWCRFDFTSLETSGGAEQSHRPDPNCVASAWPICKIYDLYSVL